MLDSQARIVEPPHRIGLPTNDAAGVERPVGFPFRVLWSTLFVALESAKSTVPPIAVNDLPGSDLPAARNFRDSPAPAASEEIEDSGSTVKWEMVIPKMARPSSRIAAVTEIAPREVPRPVPLPVYASDFPEPVPQLNSASQRTLRFRLGPPSLAAKLLLGGVLAAGIATPILIRVYHSQPQDTANREAETRAGGWMRESSAPTGAQQPRQLVLYRTSLGATDSRLEFTWKVSNRPLAWTFRAKDPDNYYAMAIKALRPGPTPALFVEHFTVYEGVESPHSSKVLILGESSSALQIRMDVSGATFKLYLEGNAADYWTDNRLGAGGLGFLEQRDQPAEVESVRMSFSLAGSQSGGA
jgi:hypothetical protein